MAERRDHDKLPKALQPFSRALAIHDALPDRFRPSDETPLQQCLAGSWPTLADLRSLIDWYDEEKLTVEQAWTILCETPDITSPEEYPDHALITMEQLGNFMARAQTAVPEGWQLVPKEATHEMLQAMFEAMFDARFDWTDAPMVGAAYDEALAAAQEAPHDN